MRNSLKIRPRLEGMESRSLLSGVGGAAAAVVSPPVQQSVHLNGTVRGEYAEHQKLPDLPRVYTLFGSGHVGLKARTALTGTIDQGGFTTNPAAHGTVYLADAHGTLTVRLTADTSKNALPDQFDYKIVGGTGAYKHAVGHGSVVLTLDKSKPPTTTTAHGVSTQHGTFDLVFVG